jgi:hypothetical protein
LISNMMSRIHPQYPPFLHSSCNVHPAPETNRCQVLSACHQFSLFLIKISTYNIIHHSTLFNIIISL